MEFSSKNYTPYIMARREYNLLIITYYWEKEERKFWSTKKLVHYGILHNGSFLLIIYSLVKIIPWGGILIIGTYARNFIFDGISDLVLYSINRTTRPINSEIINFMWKNYQLWFLLWHMW